MTEIPSCPQCGSTRWTRELRPNPSTWRESLDTEDNVPTYRSSWIDPGTGMPWQDNVVPDSWVCGKGHILDFENTIVFDLEELTYELECKGL